MTATALERRSWLCPTELDRARLLDMHARVATARRVQGLALGLASAVAAVWYGWWLVALTVLAAVILGLLERVPSWSTRPERASFGSMMLLIAVLSGSAAGTGGARSPLLAFVAVPTIMLAARFRHEVVAVGVSISLLATATAVVAGELLGPPPQAPLLVPVIAYLALLASLVATVVALLSAELQSRGDAVVDPLTGLFNRKALRTRLAEAAVQASVLDSSVAVVVCDLDHFKRVNDEHGHERGDVVLREVAYELRKALRTLDLVYRLGGEEFLVLLPGHDTASALATADRLVRQVAAEPRGGLHVTMSAGVASARGHAVDGDDLVRAADQALYEAKRAGRNRVFPLPEVMAAVGA